MACPRRGFAVRRTRPRGARHRRHGRPLRGPGRVPRALGRGASASRSAWTSPTANRRSGPRTTARSRPPSGPRVCSSPSPGSTWPRSRSRRQHARSTSGRAGSSSTPGRRASCSTTSGSSPVFALAAERRVPILIHGGAACRRSPCISAGSTRPTPRRRSSSLTPESPTSRRSPSALPDGRACTSTPQSGAPSTCSTCSRASRPARCCTRRTTRTASSPGRSCSRSGRLVSPGSRRTSSATCSAVLQRASPTASRRRR